MRKTKRNRTGKGGQVRSMFGSNQHTGELFALGDDFVEHVHALREEVALAVH